MSGDGDIRNKGAQVAGVRGCLTIQPAEPKA